MMPRVEHGHTRRRRRHCPGLRASCPTFRRGVAPCLLGVFRLVETRGRDTRGSGKSGRCERPRSARASRRRRVPGGCRGGRIRGGRRGGRRARARGFTKAGLTTVLGGLQSITKHSFRDRFAKRPRWHIHFIPTSSSWLNRVERFFGLPAQRQIRRGVHRSVAEPERAILHYIDTVNDNPRPFRWVKSADDILAAISRFCQRTPRTDPNQTVTARTSES